MALDVRATELSLDDGLSAGRAYGQAGLDYHFVIEYLLVNHLEVPVEAEHQVEALRDVAVVDIRELQAAAPLPELDFPLRGALQQEIYLGLAQRLHEQLLPVALGRAQPRPPHWSE